MSNNYPVILGIQTIEPSSDVKEEMKKASIRIITSFPFLAFPLMNSIVHYVQDDQEHIKTAAATVSRGKNDILFNVRSFMEDFKTTEQRAFLICHEMMHIMLMHQKRSYDLGYIPQIWNYATDLYINSRLAKMAENSKNLECPEFGLFGEEYLEYRSEDEIYNELLKDKSLQEALEALGEKSCGEGSGDSVVARITNEGSERPYDSIPQEDQSNNHADNNKQIVAAGLQESNPKKMGEGSQELYQALSSVLESKVPWQVLLAEFVEKSSKTRRTYTHPNRKSGRVVLPSRTGESMNLVFGVDSSGSMNPNDFEEVARELNGVLSAFDAFEVSLVSCDQTAHSLGVWCSEDGDDIEDIDVSVIGGGGTELSPIVDYANEEAQEDLEKVNCCLIVTDGGVPEDKLDAACERSEVPVMVLVTSDSDIGDNLNLNHAKVVWMKDV